MQNLMHLELHNTANVLHESEGLDWLQRPERLDGFE